MKEINLSQGKVALVDDEDFELLSQWKWSTHKNGRCYYAVRSDYTDGVRSDIKMHRVIMAPSVDMVIDHIDDDGLNNQKINLRICTTQQNASNARSGGFGASKYRGVTRMLDRPKWRANIRHNGGRILIGYFDDEVDAAKAYDNKATKLNGAFARTNF